MLLAIVALPISAFGEQQTWNSNIKANESYIDTFIQCVETPDSVDEQVCKKTYYEIYVECMIPGSVDERICKKASFRLADFDGAANSLYTNEYWDDLDTYMYKYLVESQDEDFKWTWYDLSDLSGL